MKIYKSTLKHLIKEVINEISEGGPGSGQSGHKTSEKQNNKQIYYTKCRKCGEEREVKPGQKNTCNKCGYVGITPGHSLIQNPKTKAFSIKKLK